MIILLITERKKKVKILIYYNASYHEFYNNRTENLDHSFIFSKIRKHMNIKWPEVDFVHSFDVVKSGSKQVFHLQPYDAHPNSIYYEKLSDLMLFSIKKWNK